MLPEPDRIKPFFDPPRPRRGALLTVPMTDDELGILREAAKGEGLTMSALVRRLLAAHLGIDGTE